MQIGKSEMVEFADLVAQAVVKAISQDYKNGNSGKQMPKQDKTAYQKTEQLLYNYNNFKKILEDRKKEIEDLRKYGVPQTCGAGGERVQNGNLPQGIVLEEERVEAAVREIERSVVEVTKAINMIDFGLYKLRNDPYYRVLPLRYIQGCTLEDIGVELNCDTSTVSRNKNRLVKELSMWLFSNEVATECMK